jgi:hypothetical protein
MPISFESAKSYVKGIVTAVVGTAAANNVGIDLSYWLILPHRI